MQLNELFNNGGQWNVDYRDDTSHGYEFTAGDKPFTAEFYRNDEDNQKWEVEFRRGDKIGYEQFKPSGDNDGNQFAVFATMKEIVFDFINHMMKTLSDDDKATFEIVFESDPRETSRVALYTRMMKQIGKRYPTLRGESNGNVFRIVYIGAMKRAVGESHDPE